MNNWPSGEIYFMRDTPVRKSSIVSGISPTFEGFSKIVMVDTSTPFLKPFKTGEGKIGYWGKGVIEQYVPKPLRFWPLIEPGSETLVFMGEDPDKEYKAGTISLKSSRSLFTCPVHSEYRRVGKLAFLVRFSSSEGIPITPSVFRDTELVKRYGDFCLISIRPLYSLKNQGGHICFGGLREGCYLGSLEPLSKHHLDLILPYGEEVGKILGEPSSQYLQEIRTLIYEVLGTPDVPSVQIGDLKTIVEQLVTNDEICTVAHKLRDEKIEILRLLVLELLTKGEFGEE